jgi:hypothetical protein
MLSKHKKSSMSPDNLKKMVLFSNMLKICEQGIFNQGKQFYNLQILKKFPVLKRSEKLKGRPFFLKFRFFYINWGWEMLESIPRQTRVMPIPTFGGRNLPPYWRLTSGNFPILGFPLSAVLPPEIVRPGQ